MKRNQRRVVEDRWTRKEEIGRVIQDKFKENRMVAPLQAKTQAQKEYLRNLKECQIAIGGRTITAPCNARVAPSKLKE